MRSVPNGFPYLEHSIEEVPWVRDLYDPAPVVEDGQVSPPPGPGWGVRIRESWLENAEYTQSEAD
jgi:L-alanine-DL-glutamate epimerase-like enolase superfamily enzyme